MKFFQAVAAVALAIGLATPLLAQDERPHLRVAVNDLPGSLEGTDLGQNIAVRITYNIYDNLIFRDFLADGSGGDSALTAGLAESWERIDERTLQVKLREGVLFHNGEELTSDDVVFSLSAGRGHGYAPAMPKDNFMGNLSHVVPLDRYTVQLVFKGPDPIIEQRLASFAHNIVNAREYITVGKDAYARNPVGTGPYKFDEWVEGEYVRLRAHDDYWGGRPPAETITFFEVPEVSARIAGVVSGEFDIAVNIPPDQYDLVEGYDDLKMASIVMDTMHMVVPLHDGPTENKLLRQAMSLAIDRDLLRETLWLGKNMTPNGYQLPNYPLHIPDYPGPSYDPEAARKLVEEAGYDGEEIVYRLHSTYYLLGLEAAQVLQQMWQEIGLNVTLEPTENWGQAFEPGIHMHPVSNSHYIPDPSGALAIAQGPASYIQRNPHDPARAWQAPARFNELLKEMGTSFDPEVRKAAFREALEIWDDEVPAMILYNPLEGYAMRADIQWKPYAFYYMDFRPYNLSFGVAN